MFLEGEEFTGPKLFCPKAYPGHASYKLFEFITYCGQIFGILIFVFYFGQIFHILIFVVMHFEAKYLTSPPLHSLGPT